MRSFFPGLVFVLLITGAASLRAEVKLAGLFGNNMILQRDSSAPVWGTADPGDTITLTLEDQKITAVADADGKWKTAFKGLKPGGSFTMTVAGKANRITLTNVAVGDIWVCSGQSNMEYRLADKDEQATANYPDMRYFSVPNVAGADLVTDVKDSWQVATPASVGGFVAVGYYFAKNIQKEIGVPIGLIRCGWSGITDEPFIPLDALESVPGLKEKSDAEFQKLKDLPADVVKFPGDVKAWQEKYQRVDGENKGFAAKWADPAFDAKDWKPTSTPGQWNDIGLPNGGVIWIRKTVQLPATAAGKDFRLSLGWIFATDIVYFNGEQIANEGMEPPYFWRHPRDITVPGKLVKEGDNVIAVRMVAQRQRDNRFGDGSLNLPVVDPKSVSNEWLVKVESDFAPLPPEGAASIPEPNTAKADNTCSAIYNGMISPLTSFGIKGVVWYQGESNGGNGWSYRTTFPLLIKSWREKWNQGDFPFYFVQLANYGAPQTTPDFGDGGWAQLREAQLMTWQKVPNTGMSVTIDIGDAVNIHPADKKDVGTRLSLHALANTYGQKIEYSGPIYDSMTVEGNKIRLKFTHLGGGLVAKDGPLKQFAICGADKKGVWGNAVIDGDTVVVSSPDVATPVSVRYAWGANPEGCNLYNKAGLPASPFRTDDWPLGSQGRW
jgi:sialate O-acetylesterase